MRGTSCRFHHSNRVAVSSNSAPTSLYITASPYIPFSPVPPATGIACITSFFPPQYGFMPGFPHQPMVGVLSSTPLPYGATSTYTVFPSTTASAASYASYDVDSFSSFPTIIIPVLPTLLWHPVLHRSLHSRSRLPPQRPPSHQLWLTLLPICLIRLLRLLPLSPRRLPPLRLVRPLVFFLLSVSPVATFSMVVAVVVPAGASCMRSSCVVTGSVMSVPEARAASLVMTSAMVRCVAIGYRVDVREQTSADSSTRRTHSAR